MAKRRKRPRRKAGSRPSGVRPEAGQRSGSAQAPSRGPRDGAQAAPARGDAGNTSSRGGRRSGPPALLVAASLVGLYGLALLGLMAAPSTLDPMLAGPTLAQHPLLIFATGAACLAAAVGLARSLTWGWWLGAVLAQFNLWRAAWEAIASDVATDAGASHGDWLLVSSLIRLLLFFGVAVVLHGYAVAQHFHLSWSREQERQRTHRVIYYGVGLLLALRLSGRFFGPGSSAT